MKKKLIKLSVAALGAMAVFGLTSCGGDATLKYQDGNGAEQEVKLQKTEDKKQVANIVEAMVYTAYKTDAKTDLTKLGLSGSLNYDLGVSLASSYSIQSNTTANQSFNVKATLPETVTSVEDFYNHLGFSGSLTSKLTSNLTASMGSTSLGSQSSVTDISITIKNGDGKVYSDATFKNATSLSEGTQATSTEVNKTLKGYLNKTDFFTLGSENVSAGFVESYTETYNKLKNFNLYKSLFADQEYKTIDSYLSDSNTTLEAVLTTYGVVVEGVDGDVVTFSASADFATLLQSLSSKLGNYATMLSGLTGTGKITLGFNYKTFVPTKLAVNVTNATLDLSALAGAIQATGSGMNASLTTFALELNLTTGVEVDNVGNAADYPNDVSEELLTVMDSLVPSLGN